MRIPVIDNGGQWTHREWRVLRDLGAESEILDNGVSPDALEGADGVVLSGGALSLEGTDTLGRVNEWIDWLPVPVLGICVGHQYLARHYGGTVRRSPSPEFGRARIVVEPAAGPLFGGLGPSLTVWESHNDQVGDLPPGWTRLATGPTCAVQAISDPTGRRLGVQFHPEVEPTEGGRRLLENFLSICAGSPAHPRELK